MQKTFICVRSSRTECWKVLMKLRPTKLTWIMRKHITVQMKYQ